MTKIDIISGFLGAGKTTLIKKLIKEGFKGEKLVLIENEFGEIGIDGGFLKEGGIEITEMNSGCICCSLVGDFGTALKEVLEKYNPDRVIIEPSGVGKLSDVIKAVKQVALGNEVSLNGKVAVVDALKCKMYMKNFGEFFNNQIESASTIILSRSQNCSEEKLHETVKLIKTRNAEAAIVTTAWEEIAGDKLLVVMESGNYLERELLEEEEICPHCGGHHHEHDHHEDKHHHEHHDEEGHDHDEHCDCKHHAESEKEEHHHKHDEGCSCGHDHHHEHGHHHADEVFTSWGMETPRRFDKEEIRTILEKLAHTETYGVILRAKGILQDKEGNWFCFDMVPGEYEIREEAADYTGRLCIIGTKLDEAGLKELLGEY